MGGNSDRKRDTSDRKLEKLTIKDHSEWSPERPNEKAHAKPGGKRVEHTLEHSRVDAGDPVCAGSSSDRCGYSEHVRYRLPAAEAAKESAEGERIVGIFCEEWDTSQLEIR